MPKMPLPRRPFFQEAEAGEELEGARLLPLDVIDANPHQARQVFDEQALKELADSIREHGVLEPILVRSLDGRYQVVAGERRTRAARLAGLSDIPAVVREMTDEQAAYATAIENIQREDMDLEDTARWLSYLRELTGLSQRELAKRLGKTHNWVSRRLRLLDRPDLLARIRDGSLTQEAALDIIARKSDGDEVYQADTEAERAELDGSGVYQPDTARRNGPHTFRWRPMQRFATWVNHFELTKVPPDERATFRAQVADLRARLESLERELDASER